jgi:toxin ParE1/3/4
MTKTYDLYITRAAEHDIQEATDYIDYTLLNPSAADTLFEEVDTAAAGLASTPGKYPFADDRVLRSWGVHFILIRKYLLFYIIRNDLNTVYIIRFLHSRRHWISILHEGISFD